MSRSTAVPMVGGHDRGCLNGMTVSRTRVDSFRGVIASGYWCHQKLEVKHGAAPFLLLIGERIRGLWSWRHLAIPPSVSSTQISGQERSRCCLMVVGMPHLAQERPKTLWRDFYGLP